MADIFGQVPLEAQPELQAINRQQELSKLLLQQGMQQPQGQMVSGHYVAPSLLQHLQPLFGAYAGSKGMETAEKQQLELAKTLRQQKGEAISEFQRLMSDPATRGQAMQFAAGNQYLQSMAQELMKPQKLGEGEKFVMPSIGGGEPVELAAGGIKYRAPIQIDTGTAIEIRDPNDPTKVLQRLPKTHVFAPHASQLVPVQGGFAEYNPNTKSLTAIGGGQGGAAGTMSGAGATSGALMPPLPQHLQTEVSSINQQKSTINDALKTIQANKDAFGPKFAAPGILAGEFGTSRMNEKLTSPQVEARAKVFNIASSVIKERAGTAQSKQEQAIIMRFLPSPFDGEKAITDKFNAFNDYLTSKEKGITPVIGAVPAYRPSATQSPAATTGNNTQNFDPALLEFMTPEQQALFKQPGK
jgi:hypothetical protein